MAWPVLSHATPENSLKNLFNPSFAINIASEPTRNRHDLAVASGEASTFNEGSSNASPDDYLQTAFDYLNRKLGFSGQDVSLKPMVGLDVFKSFDVSPGITIMPEIYAIYRYEAIDDNLPLFDHHSLQTGLGVGLNMSDTLSARFSMDSDLLTGNDHRIAFMMKYRW